MNLRNIIFSLLLIAGVQSVAQPPEVVYLGSIAKTGYVNNASYGPFEIGFNFTFYGNTYTQFFVSSNGLITFGEGSADGTEDPIPTADLPNNYIAAFWDDLAPDISGKILYTTIGAAPNRKLIVQWKNMNFYNLPKFMGTFSAILYESDNSIQIQYRLIVDNNSARAHGDNATIGIENSDGTAGIQYSYHNPTAIKTGQAILFTPSGSTYDMDTDALYEGVYLTTNLSLPEPSIPTLISPPQDAVIGSDYTFVWSDADYSASNTLLISLNSDLVYSTNYPAGTGLTYDVSGLDLDQTYYWGVFANNSTGTTWCEIKTFSTSSAPPLATVPQEIWIEKGQEKTINLNYTGGDASAKTATITSLPAEGQLYQYNSGVKGSLISSVPQAVSDPGRNVIYVANGSIGNDAGNFSYFLHDDTGDSPEGTITVNVSPPGIPNVLYVAKKGNVEIQFDRKMADPSGKEDQFTVTVNGTPAVITSLSLKEGDPYSIVATLNPALAGGETVSVSYTAGDIASVQGGWLATFYDMPVTLTAQTITFPPLAEKKYGDADFSPGATASSGLAISYSSSKLAVASIIAGKVHILSVGTSEITARQAGNTTYAPARYTRTLTVIKGDQAITFNPPADRTYGDGDFNVSATASSGLPVSFSANNPAVATISGATIHITGGGVVTITASQAGNSLWNPAPDVPVTLTVNRADLTFTASDNTRVYKDVDPLFEYTISGFLFSDDEVVLDQLPSIVTDANVDSPVGDYTITFSGGSDNSYNYLFVPATLTITRAEQVITFDDYPDRLLVSTTGTLEASSSSGLEVLFESMDDEIATVAGSQVTGVSDGTVDIRAYNDGGENYFAAEEFASIVVNSTHRDIMYLFTPNYDGINDLWEIPEMNEWGRCDVKVYNRWGKLVYSKDNYSNEWDGISNGSPLPEGAYYFIIKTENRGTVKGTVNIVR